MTTNAERRGRLRVRVIGDKWATTWRDSAGAHVQFFLTASDANHFVPPVR